MSKSIAIIAVTVAAFASAVASDCYRRISSYENSIAFDDVSEFVVGGVREVEVARDLAERFDAELEVILEDGSRVDLLTMTHAIELDRAHKWAEAIGQSMHYAMLTGREPAVILFTSDPQHDWRHLVRASRVCGRLGIRLSIEVVNEDPKETGD